MMPTFRTWFLLAAAIGDVACFHAPPGLFEQLTPAAAFVRQYPSVAIALDPSSVQIPRPDASAPDGNGPSTSSKRSRRRRRSRRRSGRQPRRRDRGLSQTRAARSPPERALSVLRPLGYVLLTPWRARAGLRAAWGRCTARGAREIDGVDFSILRCRNDFELATRATRELEHILDTYFETPCGKAVGLAIKVRLARTVDGEPLSAGLRKRVKHLVKIRNALVHKRAVDAIPHRRAFVTRLEEVLRELAVEKDRIQRERRGVTVAAQARRADAQATRANEATTAGGRALARVQEQEVAAGARPRGSELPECRSPVPHVTRADKG